MDIWQVSDAKARLIISTLVSDFADCRTAEDHVAFADHVLKTFADNNLTIILSDELQDHYLDNDDETRKENS